MRVRHGALEEFVTLKPGETHEFGYQEGAMFTFDCKDKTCGKPEPFETASGQQIIPVRYTAWKTIPK